MNTKLIFALILLLSSNALAAKRALIYNGPGACSDGCYQSAFQVAQEAGLDPVYVDQNALDKHSTDADVQAFFQDVALWIQPGGTSQDALKAISKKLKSSLEDFVRAGGGYVGFCAGAFSSTQYDGDSHTLGFDFMPGKTILYPTNHQAEIVEVQWQGKPRDVYWEGGPYLSAIPDGQAEVIATYPEGTIASARSIYGAGKVFVTGFHPEAPQEWRDYYHLTDPDGLDHDLAIQMINWATSNP